jgi:hypothetical protein
MGRRQAARVRRRQHDDAGCGDIERTRETRQDVQIPGRSPHPHVRVVVGWLRCRCLVDRRVAADTAEMADRAAPRSRPAAGGLIRPMLATAGPVPVGPGWAFEVKFDGVLN